MTKIISFFTQKGGVGKTTTAHNVAVALTKKGKNVLLIDADAQMNLTASVLGLSDSVEYAESNTSKWVKARAEYTDISKYLEYYRNKHMSKEVFNLNLYDYNPKNTYPDLFNDDRGYLTLLLGTENVFAIENTLYSVATNMSLRDDDRFYKIQSAIKDLASYKNRNYDYIIIDTSPSASSILNGTLIMMSDYFISPLMPNFFSLQAVNNFSDIIQNWVNLLMNFRATPTKGGLNFQPKFLGVVINHAKRFEKDDDKKVTIYAEKWGQKINQSINKFAIVLTDSERVVRKEEFSNIFSKSSPYIIDEICDFTGNLRAVSEITGVPIVDLNNEIVKLGFEKLGIMPFTITKVRSNTKDDHYKRAFAEASKSYNYIAESLLKLK